MKDSEIIKKAEDIIGEILGLLEVEAEKEVSMEVDVAREKFLKVAIIGEELGHLIGYRGRTLNSLQLIFVQILNHEVGEPVTVLVDVNNHRDKRMKHLESLAQRATQQAKESGQNVELPPFSAYERRIVHMILKDEEGIITESEGEGAERHIVIKQKEKTKENEKETKGSKKE